MESRLLQARIIELDATLSNSESTAPVTPFSATYDVDRNSSVTKLVAALNRAAYEVETPRPWEYTRMERMEKDRSTIKKIVPLARTGKKTEDYELRSSFDSKGQEVEALKNENSKLRATIDKLKEEMEIIKRNSNGNVKPPGLTPEAVCVSPSQEVPNEVLSGLIEKTNAQIDLLRADAEKKLLGAAEVVEQLRVELDVKSAEVIACNQTIFQLRSSLTQRSQDEKESKELRGQLDQLTVAYNESAANQKQMKITMSQAVDKLKQFIQELDKKSKELLNQKEQNAALEKRIFELEGVIRQQSQSILSSQHSDLPPTPHADPDTSLEEISLSDVPVHPSTFLLSDSLQVNHKLQYLRQAFRRLCAASSSDELLSLGRVMCSILAIEGQDQTALLHNLSALSSSAAVASSISKLAAFFE